MASLAGGLDYSQSDQQRRLSQPWGLPSEPSRDDISYRESQNVELTKKSAEPLISDSDHAFTSPSPPRSFRSSVLYNWWMSIVSVIISVLAIIALVAFLIVADGSSLPKLPLKITINTYISFFVAIAKAAMLVPVADSIGQLKWLWFRQPRCLQDIQTFDEASRGPLVSRSGRPFTARSVSNGVSSY
jgi:hypothetical protein